MTDKDTLQRFIFDNANVRGEIVHLNHSYQTVIHQADYPEPLKQLMGEAMCAVILLTATLKFSGRLSMQLQGDGALTLLLVQATHNREIRGAMKWEDGCEKLTFREMMKNARMVITIEPDKGTRYQGIVPLERDRLNQCLEAYFLQSEQLPTRIWLAADDDVAAGMLLQRLPESDEAGRPGETGPDHDWEHITILAETTTAGELLTLANDTLLYRLFHAETVRLFDRQPVEFKCTCSRERCENTIISLGSKEISEIISSQGHVAMTCEFCMTEYFFEADQLLKLSEEADRQEGR